MIKRIMGIDASSTCIGYSLLELDNETNVISFKDVNNYKPIKSENLLDRLFVTRNNIKNIIENFKPDYIAIEDIIPFMKGKSSATTIITLACFNRMIGLLCYDYLGHAPEYFNVLQIRHGLKNNKILPKKEDMPELVATHLGFIFPYIYKKNGKIAEESEDMADAIAVALYYSFILNKKIIRKIKKIKSKKKKGIKL